MIKIVTLVCGFALLTGLARASPAHVSLIGAGSTFDFPYFDKAFHVYGTKHNVSVNYQPVGSGAGIQQFTSKLIDFGASDVPMNPTSELPAAVKAGGAVEQIPIALGGISMAYNVPGVKSGLHLNGSIVANIFLGVIKTWNDKAIKKLNKKVRLPNLAITVVHRSDGSGTSFAFTDYLSHTSDQWNAVVGTSKLPNWPVGVGGKGNLGVAQLVQQIAGSIGYVELAYVLQTHMHEAQMQNAKHQFVYPNLKTVAVAAEYFKHVSANKFSIVNSKAKSAYPIVTYSWLLIFRHQPNASKGRALISLVHWLLTSGQKYAKSLDYVPLPSVVQKLGLSDLKHVKVIKN